jgi:hypothetical protein
MLLVNSLTSRQLLSNPTSLLLVGSLTSDLPVNTAARTTRMSAQGTLLRDCVLVAAIVLLLHSPGC